MIEEEVDYGWLTEEEYAERDAEIEEHFLPPSMVPPETLEALRSKAQRKSNPVLDALRAERSALKAEISTLRDPDDDNFYATSRSHHVSNGRWLGTKGDRPGHPFRGNQHVRGESSPDFEGSVVEPVAFLAEAMDAYIAENGGFNTGSGEPDWSAIKADPRRGRRIAAHYAELPEHDDSPETTAAYTAMRDEISKQFDYLTGTLGVDVQVVDSDPYPTVAELADDLRTNRRLLVLATATTGSHPFLTDDENDKFRAVHDAFGHAAIGRGFDRNGEEAAFQSHRRMMPNAQAVAALATETRGQNSALIFGPEPGVFQPQKLALLPEDDYVKTLSAEWATKGDRPGHPFRGNQHVRVSGSIAAGPSGVDPGDMTMALTRAQGGMTVEENSFAPITTGYAVAVMPERSFARDFRDVTGEDIDAWLNDQADALAPTDTHLGTWLDPDTGTLWLDVVKVFPHTPSGRAQAISTGIEKNQIGIMDLDALGAGEDGFIETGGTGEAKADRKIVFTIFDSDEVDGEMVLAWCATKVQT